MNIVVIYLQLTVLSPCAASWSAGTAAGVRTFAGETNSVCLMRHGQGVRPREMTSQRASCVLSAVDSAMSCWCPAAMCVSVVNVHWSSTPECALSAGQRLNGSSLSSTHDWVFRQSVLGPNACYQFCDTCSRFSRAPFFINVHKNCCNHGCCTVVYIINPKVK